MTPLLSPGRRLGPYEVLVPIATGGTSVVYRARDTRLDRDVALEVLPEPLASDRAAVARFEAEARAVAALSHPGIVAIHDFGRIDGATYAVTELLEGETLRVAILRGGLPPSRALDVAAQVAEALAAAHERGLVHRDLKPENVFLAREGRAKVLDFGLAVRSGPLPTREGESETSTDPVLLGAGGNPGTAAYMSPEQARGLAADAPSDQFSLGVVLYEMLAGVPPFRGSSQVELLSSILHDDPPPLSARVPDLPESVQGIVERCLAKQPDERYASTLDLARDLRACAARFRDGRFPRRVAASPGRVLWIALAAALVLLAVGFVVGRWAAGGTP